MKQTKNEKGKAERRKGVMIDGREWVRRYDAAVSAQANMQAMWDDCRRYIMPQESYYTGVPVMGVEGKPKAYPVDATAISLWEKMASGLHSATVSYGDRWFSLLPVNADRQTSAWCVDYAVPVVMQIMQNSNFLSAMSDFIRYECCYGTGVVYCEETEDGVAYRNLPIINNVFVENDAHGDVSVVYVGYSWTARQAVMYFGEEHVSPEVRSAFRTDSQSGMNAQKFSFICATYPKKAFGEEYDPSARETDERSFPFGQIFIEKDTGFINRIKGFREFPYAVCPFMLAGDEVYGRSIPMLAMPAIKSLNRATGLLMEASEMAIHPPIGVPASFPKLDLRPGKMTRVQMQAPNQIWTYSTNANIPVGDNLVARITETLRTLFKEDFFMAISKRGEMTAAEVEERVRQASEFISPIVLNLQHYAFKPLVMRTLAIAERRGWVPKRPEGASDIKIVFSSRIDSLVRQAYTNKVMTFLNQASSVGGAMNVNPDLQHVLNTDKIYDDFCDAMGLSPSIMKSARERAESRQAAAQAAAAAQQAELQAQQLARTDLSKNVEPDSVLARRGGM